MSSSGSDTLEFEIPTFLLEFANDDQYVSSNRRKIGDTSDGYWWLDCYPNNDGNVSVELRVSCKDIAVEYSVAIKGTDVLGTDKLTTSVKSLSKCWDLISHDDLMESDAIQNDAFVLICNAKFEARDNPDESDTKIVEDSLKIEFSNNDLYDATSDSDECWTPSRLIPGYRQLFWSVDYYPRGTCEPGFCAFIRSEYDVKYELAIHYKNMYLKSTMLTPFSQEQLNASSDNDRVPVYVNTFFEVPKVEDIDEIFEMCTVPNGSLAVNAIRLKLSPLLFHEDYIGDFDSSPMQQAQNSDKVEFRMRCYGAGDRPFNKNYVSIFVDIVSTAGTRLMVAGSLSIEGMPNKTDFHQMVDQEITIGFSRFISHDDIRDKRVIMDNVVVIECAVMVLPNSTAILRLINNNFKE